MNDMRYSKTHEWVKTEGAVVSVGVTEYAAEQMGDAVFVELPEIGASLKIGKPFASIESIKAVSEVISPVTGRITEINQSLLDSPEAINRDALSAWLIRAEVSAFDGTLMDEAEYNKAVSVSE